MWTHLRVIARVSEHGLPIALQCGSNKKVMDKFYMGFNGMM